VSYGNATIRGCAGSVKIGDTHMSRESTTKRKYELKQRAEEMAKTHRRITEAAIDLHGSLGPARTTLSAVAKHAGVERRTLYRHFPSEADLFAACSAHYFTANPWPDLGSWRAIQDPHRRLEQALDELYAYYERTEPMFSNVLRDAELF
jgi:AcrR family transcriptional regulator